MTCYVTPHFCSWAYISDNIKGWDTCLIILLYGKTAKKIHVIIRYSFLWICTDCRRFIMEHIALTSQQPICRNTKC
nr:MAG TPA_asm: hypothetical protein [Caudoviricetes sp.]